MYNRFQEKLESLNQIEEDLKKKPARYSKYRKSDDPSYPSSGVKNSIQGLITPVVQISYNQIKSVNDSTNSFDKRDYKNYKPAYSQRSNRLDVMNSANSLSHTLSRKSKKDVREFSLDRSLNKGSFVSAKEATSINPPQFNSIKPNKPSTSFQQNIKGRYEEDDTDEHYPGETLPAHKNNPINNSIQHTKRSMSEMQKHVRRSVGSNIAPFSLVNKIREKNKNQPFTTLNGIKTVSLNDFTVSTNSGGNSSAKQYMLKSQN